MASIQGRHIGNIRKLYDKSIQFSHKNELVLRSTILWKLKFDIRDRGQIGHISKSGGLLFFWGISTQVSIIRRNFSKKINFSLITVKETEIGTF